MTFFLKIWLRLCETSFVLCTHLLLILTVVIYCFNDENKPVNNRKIIYTYRYTKIENISQNSSK